MLWKKDSSGGFIGWVILASDVFNVYIASTLLEETMDSPKNDVDLP